MARNKVSLHTLGIFPKLPSANQLYVMTLFAQGKTTGEIARVKGSPAPVTLKALHDGCRNAGILHSRQAVTEYLQWREKVWEEHNAREQHRMKFARFGRQPIPESPVLNDPMF